MSESQGPHLQSNLHLAILKTLVQLPCGGVTLEDDPGLFPANVPVALPSAQYGVLRTVYFVLVFSVLCTPEST